MSTFVKMRPCVWWQCLAPPTTCTKTFYALASNLPNRWRWPKQWGYSNSCPGRTSVFVSCFKVCFTWGNTYIISIWVVQCTRKTTKSNSSFPLFLLLQTSTLNLAFLCVLCGCSPTMGTFWKANASLGHNWNIIVLIIIYYKCWGSLQNIDIDIDFVTIFAKI